MSYEELVSQIEALPTDEFTRLREWINKSFDNDQARHERVRQAIKVPIYPVHDFHEAAATIARRRELSKGDAE